MPQTSRSFPAIRPNHSRRQPLPIEDYALIGDLHSAALVGLDGSIDWLCLPAFSSDACFAALLGTPGNGRWLLRPKDELRSVTRRYRPATLILETTMETSSGTVVITDLMSVRINDQPNVIRVVECTRGKVKMCSELVIRFDFGNAVPWVTMHDDGLHAVVGPDALALRTPEQVHGEELASVSDFTLKQGQRTHFVLTYTQSHLPAPPVLEWKAAIADTEKFWQEWSAQSSYKGEYHEAVQRSLITVKALTYRPSGGIVAAPTTSLPEKLGGVRNWDYRYCWLRDTTFTLLALLNAGYYEEGRAWHDWLMRALAGQANQIQIVYGICGERRLPEQTLDHLDGYQGAKPVRLGNGASQQVQLDVYGEVLDAMFHAFTVFQAEKLEMPEAIVRENVGILLNLITHLEKAWQQPDRGLWEFRSEPKHYTHSKVMVWVAFDRAIAIAKMVPDDLRKNLPVKRWAKIREQVHHDVCKYGFNRSMNSFTQSFGSKHMDASLLIIPLVGFLPPDDPRIAGTVEAVQKSLTKDGLILRYHSGPKIDGFPAGEGAFLACSFWMVSCLRLLGRTGEAREMFDRILALRNDVGLLAEEYDSDAKRQVGNFPQAFSHISLLHTAYALSSDLEVFRRHTRHEHKPSGASTLARGRNETTSEL